MPRESESEPTGRKVSPAAKSAPQRALRILVVDDNLDELHSLAYLLRDDGHHVDFAINATVALDVARRTAPEVVLLDIGLPDGNGIKVLGVLRLMPDMKKARVIAITGRRIEDNELTAAGFDGILRKPFDYRALSAVLSGH